MMTEMQIEMESYAGLEPVAITEPLILEDLVIETLAIDGICGVY